MLCKLPRLEMSLPISHCSNPRNKLSLKVNNSYNVTWDKKCRLFGKVNMLSCQVVHYKSGFFITSREETCITALNQSEVPIYFTLLCSIFDFKKFPNDRLKNETKGNPFFPSHSFVHYYFGICPTFFFLNLSKGVNSTWNKAESFLRQSPSPQFQLFFTHPFP